MTIASQEAAESVTASATSGWLLPVVIGLLGAAAVIALIAVIRERHHRQRREALDDHLSSLEGVLVNLAGEAAADPASSANVDVDPAALQEDSFSPRGPLSTAISILCSDGTLSLPAPDRVDLRATCFIYENLTRSLSPAELADGLNVSLRSLQRGLAGSLECTPRELILAIKMREAKRHLVEGGALVQEAGRAVGFDDPFHFSRRFKSYYRVSPTEMQERVNRNVA